MIDLEGNSKPIEQIQVGEMVLARNELEPHGPLELKRVEELFTRTSPIIELEIGGQKIGTTDEHPFYVPAREAFVPARELQVGDQLVSHDGRLLRIDAIHSTLQIATVYNLRVADYHTYFVGGALWGWDVWAHNACKLFTKMEFEAQKGKVKWVPENTTAGENALKYQGGAAGARSGEAAALIYKHKASNTYRMVKFDSSTSRRGLIDRKFSEPGTLYPFHRDKVRNAALRQSEALKQNGKKAVWEVTDSKNQKAARDMLDDLGIKNITVRVVKPK